MNILVAGDFEACEAFRAAIDDDEPLCASCGHLADDHDHAAEVRPLPRRPVRRPLPTRKAS